jgi:hypothetical protein
MRSPLGCPPLIGPVQSNDRRASGGGLARLIESSRDVMTSEIGTSRATSDLRSSVANGGKPDMAARYDAFFNRRTGTLSSCERTPIEKPGLSIDSLDATSPPCGCIVST